MSRKDYILLAEALKSSKPDDENATAATLAAWCTTVESIANALGRENGRFDFARFLRATGYDPVSVPVIRALRGIDA